MVEFRLREPVPAHERSAAVMSDDLVVVLDCVVELEVVVDEVVDVVLDVEVDVDDEVVVVVFSIETLNSIAAFTLSKLASAR